MSFGLRLTINIFTGLIIGAAVVFIALALTLVFAFVTGGGAALPGIIDIWATNENDAVALNFNPNFAGMGIAVLVVAAAFAGLTTYFAQRRQKRRTVPRLG